MHDMGTQVLLLSPCASCGEGANASQPEKLFKPLKQASWDTEELRAVSSDDLLAFNVTNTEPKIVRSIEFVRRRVETSVVAWSDALRAFGVEPDEAAVREVLKEEARVV